MSWCNLRRDVMNQVFNMDNFSWTELSPAISEVTADSMSTDGEGIPKSGSLFPKSGSLIPTSGSLIPQSGSLLSEGPRLLAPFAVRFTSTLLILDSILVIRKPQFLRGSRCHALASGLVIQL